MKVLFLDSIDRDTFGGYENWILTVAGYFVERGHDVSIVGRPRSEYLRRARLVDERIDVVPLAISGDFNPVTINRIKQLLDEKQIDIMTVNFNKDVRLGGLAARWQGRTRIVWRLGLDVTGDGWAHRFLTPRLVDGMIVPSEALKVQVTRRSYIQADMVRVIHNGSEEPGHICTDDNVGAELRARYKLAADRLIAVTVGRFVDQKGHVYLVEAAREIVKRFPSVLFLLLGDGPLEPMLRQKISELGLEDNFLFAGMLDNVELEMAGSDLMIHSAIEEPFSHAILEGMRCGLPIVASNVGGVPEALIDGESGLLVRSREQSELAAAVITMLASSEKRVAIGKAARERWQENFRLETMVDKVEAYMTGLLS